MEDIFWKTVNTNKINNFVHNQERKKQFDNDDNDDGNDTTTIVLLLFYCPFGVYFDCSIYAFILVLS